eukprot:m.143342 g.143342  ORF g.143342 m.143342 type:complete len:306 (-) comp16738_c0_seq4:1050-1967(-)
MTMMMKAISTLHQRAAAVVGDSLFQLALGKALDGAKQRPTLATTTAAAHTRGHRRRWGCGWSHWRERGCLHGRGRWGRGRSCWGCRWRRRRWRRCGDGLFLRRCCCWGGSRCGCGCEGRCCQRLRGSLLRGRSRFLSAAAGAARCSRGARSATTATAALSGDCCGAGCDNLVLGWLFFAARSLLCRLALSAKGVLCACPRRRDQLLCTDADLERRLHGSQLHHGEEGLCHQLGDGGHGLDAGREDLLQQRGSRRVRREVGNRGRCERLAKYHLVEQVAKGVDVLRLHTLHTRQLQHVRLEAGWQP